MEAAVRSLGATTGSHSALFSHARRGQARVLAGVAFVFALAILLSQRPLAFGRYLSSTRGPDSSGEPSKPMTMRIQAVRSGGTNSQSVETENHAIFWKPKVQGAP
jgi:hypothetical protein